MKNPTNAKLSAEIQEVKREVHHMNTIHQSFQATVQSKLQELHDFMIVQKDRQSHVRHTNGKLDWNKIGIGLVAFLGTMGTVLLALVKVIEKLVQ